MKDDDFFYRGKWCHDMSKEELIDLAKFLMRQQENEIKRHAAERDRLFGLIRSSQKTLAMKIYDKFFDKG